MKIGSFSQKTSTLHHANAQNGNISAHLPLISPHSDTANSQNTYTDSGQLKSLTDPVGNTTSYEYDELGRPVKETNELGKSRVFEYLAGRMMAKKTDRNGRITMFEHDDFGRVIAEKWLSADGKLVETIAFQYNAFGKLEKVVDSSGMQTFGYDDLGRNTQTVMQLTGLEAPITFENRFDEMNRRIQVSAKVGRNVDFVNQYEYDALGRVTGITQNEKRVNYTYNTIGQRIATSVYSGVNKVYDTLYQYDGLGRLTDLTHVNGEKVFASYDYSWDAGNRIASMNDADYGYDKTSQLMSAEYEKLPCESYEYDANGNCKVYETGKNNQILSDGTFDYKYDDEGNRIEKKLKAGERTKYIWDHRNRLVQVITPKETVSYQYDHKNCMIRRNSGFIVHDGWQIALTLDAKGEVKDRNLWGTKRDELIAMNDKFVLCDHLGSVRDIVDAKGKMLSHVEYDTFGKVVRQTGKSDCIFGYTGKMFDDVTGLQWNIYRWYDVNIKQWLSVDPLGVSRINRNLYEYSNNNPVGQVDPFGLLSSSNANHVLGCLFLKFPNDGLEENKGKRFICNKLRQGGIIDAANETFTSLMLSGIPLPDSLRGTIGVSGAIEIAQHLLENAFSGTDISDISVKDIIDALRNVSIDAMDNVVGADIPLLAEGIKMLFGDIVGFSGSNCTFLYVGYSTTHNHSQHMRYTIGCRFRVCATLRRQWNGIRYITDWTAEGFCGYSCVDGSAGFAAGMSHKCKDNGLECRGNVSVSGSGRGVGGRCTVHNS